MPIERADWSDAGTVPTSSVPAVVTDQTRQSRTDQLAPVDWRGTDLARARAATDPGDGGIDADIVNTARGLLKNGVYRPDEVARMYNLSPAELAAAQRPAQSVQQSNRRSVEQQLASIDKFRRSDRAAYNKDIRLQARERALIAQLETFKSDAASDLVETAADGADGELDVSWADPALISEWRQHGGLKHHVAVVRAAVTKAFDELDEQEAHGLSESFSQLPPGAQTSIYGFLAVEPASWRKADAEDVAYFTNLEDTAPLIREWGPRAAEQVGVVVGRSKMMLNRMSAADREKTNDWIDSLSPSQFRAVAKALAR